MKKQFRMFGPIVDDDSQKWGNDDVTPSGFNAFIRSLAADDELELMINSPGGSVTAGLAIANMVAAMKQPVTAKIYGMAASMGSVIAAAAPTMVMPRNAFFMIHNPWTIEMGDADELRKTAALLDSMKAAIMGFYRGRFPGKSDADISALMDEETWISGEQAEAFGLKCTVEDPIKAAASVRAPAFGFAKMPEAASAYYEAIAASPASAPGAAAAPTDAADGAGTSSPAAIAVEGEAEDDGAEPPDEPEAPATPPAPVAAAPAPAVTPPAPDAETPAPSAASRSEPFLALHRRADEIEQQRRDIQSRADRLSNELDTERKAFASFKAQAAIDLAAKDKTISEYEARLSALALSALGVPAKGCAQSWPEALAECGGNYETAKAKYPALAEAFRVAAQKRQGND